MAPLQDAPSFCQRLKTTLGPEVPPCTVNADRVLERRASLARVALSLLATVPLISAGCGHRAAGQRERVAPREPPVATLRFEDIAHEAGIHHRWGHNGKTPLTNLESFGTGCAFWDYDGDGWLDVLLVDEPNCRLYRNRTSAGGRERFEEVTEVTGLSRVRGPWKGCAIGDWNADGHLDLFLTGYYKVALLANVAGKRVVDVTLRSQIRHHGWASSAGFADYDGDGDLDLYVGNYVQFGPKSVQHCTFPGGAVGGCPPQVYPAERGKLYRNNGDGTFSDVTAAAGMTDTGGKTLALGWCDFDLDGDPDLYLANDGIPGDLYRNDSGRFTNIGILSGTAFGVNHLAQAGMGVDWADYDRSGRPDLVVTAFSNESYSLYRSQGDFFINVSAEAGIAQPTFKPLGFGCRFLDADNDGWPDLVFANGHVYDQSQRMDPETPYRQKLILMRNEQGQRFNEVTVSAGADVQRPIVGRGLATGDFDNDGRVDILVVDYEGAPMLLRNLTETRSHWLRLNLRMGTTGRDPFAFGARVTLESALGRQIAEVVATASYLSSNDPRLHFGIGSVSTIDSIRVDWPNGVSELFEAPQVDTEYVLTAGSGRALSRNALR
jgi:enediyne biosynthesis protein E4